MEYELNRIQYVILNIMKKNDALDSMRSMSCNEISDYEKHSKVCTIYKHMRILESYGLVRKGAKVERAFGYVLTKEAIKLLPVDNNEGGKINDQE